MRAAHARLSRPRPVAARAAVMATVMAAATTSIAAACLAAVPAGAQAVVVASQQGARLTRVADGRAAESFAVAPSPAVIAADAAGRLYASHPDGRAVSVIEADGAVRRLPFPGQAFGLAVEPDGRSLYVGDWSGNRVVRLSVATGAVEGETRVGPDPAGLVLGPGGRLYVAEREGRSVGVVDTARMERVAGLPVGEGPFALGYDPVRGRLYVANVRSDDVTVIDTGGDAGPGRVVARVPAGASPYGVAITPDGASVLVTNQRAGTVSVIDAERLVLSATVPVGQYPEGVAVVGGPGAYRAYVANWFSDDVSVIDLATVREAGRIPVAEGPRTLAVPPPGPASGRAR